MNGPMLTRAGKGVVGQRSPVEAAVWWAFTLVLVSVTGLLAGKFFPPVAAASICRGPVPDAEGRPGAVGSQGAALSMPGECTGMAPGVQGDGRANAASRRSAGPLPCAGQSSSAPSDQAGGVKGAGTEARI